MRVAVGSKNPVKIAAVREAFTKVWPEKSFVFEGVDISSGVTDQPMSDEESFTGARNRAERAMKALDADFGIGLEGGLQNIGEKWFDSGCIVVLDKHYKEGRASSIRMETPPKMMELVQQGIELGIADDMIFKEENSKHGEGHFGLMTNGLISRQHGYADAVVAALAAFLHPELF